MTARLYLAGAIAAAMIAAGGALYLSGRHDEAGKAENRNLKATERQRAERDKTDADIRQLDHAGLCARLGGVWRDGQCD
jgi:hypothetical protein